MATQRQQDGPYSSGKRSLDHAAALARRNNPACLPVDLAPPQKALIKSEAAGPLEFKDRV
jgi:hypothetical protein